MEAMDLIENRIKTSLAKRFQKAETEITKDSRLVQDLGMDSLDTLELLFELENEFNIGIPTTDAMGFAKVHDVAAYVYEKTRENKPGP